MYIDLKLESRDVRCIVVSLETLRDHYAKQEPKPMLVQMAIEALNNASQNVRMQLPEGFLVP